jgi:hypothetical protein
MAISNEDFQQLITKLQAYDGKRNAHLADLTEQATKHAAVVAAQTESATQDARTAQSLSDATAAFADFKAFAETLDPGDNAEPTPNP